MRPRWQRRAKKSRTSPPRSLRFAAQSCGIAVVLGFLISRKLLFSPGIVGLIHDWSVPPAAAQNATLASQIFNGWYTWGLGMPVVFPTEYPLKFALGVAGAAGVGGDVLSKIIVAGLPALAFLSAVFLFGRLGIAPWASWIAAAFYALNPVMLNKLVSGQSTYLLGYAAIPVVLASILEARSRRHWFWVGIQTGGVLALAAVQIQLGLLAYAVVVVAALCAGEVPVLRRFGIVALATACFFVTELPTVIGVTSGISTFDTLQIFRPNQAWLAANSIHPLDALRLSGYLTHYDASAVRGFMPLWSVAGFLVAIAAVCGYFFAAWWLRTFALVCALGAFLLVTGIYSPIGPLISWLFVHVRPMEVFRELYHIMAALALVYAIGLAFFFHSPTTDWRRFAARAGILVALGIYVMPMLSGNVAGWLRVFGYSADMDRAYAMVSHDSRRTVWFPIDQPLAYDGRGAGVDPMFVTRSGSFWLYTLAWPFSAIDMAARAHHWREVQGGLRQLSVGRVIERQLFSSRLANFIPPNTNSMSAYVQEPMPRLALGTIQQQIISNDTAIGTLPGAKPLAFSTSGAAIAPPRIDLLMYAPRDAALLPYGTTLPANVPYVVITRAGNEADEALTNVAQLAMPAASGPNQGFAPIQDWWWYRPEYAEASSGWLTIGEHRVDIPIATNFSNAVLVLSFQATPVGGRIEIAAVGRHWVIDTSGRSDSIFSRTFALGSVPSGATIGLRTEDPGEEVALLSARLVERPQYDAAIAALDVLRRASRGVITFHASNPAYRTARRGNGSSIGNLDPERTYTLRITYSASDGGYVDVRNQTDYLIARARVPTTAAGSTEVRFDGFDGEFSLHPTHGVRLRNWQLASAALEDAISPPASDDVVAAQWKPDGSAVFRDRLPLHTLNESYSWIWGTSVPVLAHVPSIFGTNVYITNDEPLMSVENGYAPLLRSTYIVGCILILASLALLAMGSRSTITRG